MSRTTVLSPAALTIGQNVSLLTSVTCPTVTVGPAVSKLDLTLRFTFPLFLKLKLLRPTFFELKIGEENEEDEPIDSFDEEELSKKAVPTNLGEVHRLRVIAKRRVNNSTVRYGGGGGCEEEKN